MAIEFPKLLCAAYIAGLAGMFALCQYTYNEPLWQMSHQIIKDMQATTSSDSFHMSMLKTFSDWTEDEHYVLAVLAMWPFVCRERFWYYLSAIALTSFTKINLKMFQSEPRPVWEWSDLTDLGCSPSFGSPSGHSTRSSNFAFLLILDLFFASDYSRTKYTELKQMSPRSNPCFFVALTLVTVSFWLFNLYDRVFLGKHGINQVLLGSQLGIWCAFFSHFILRDILFSHFTKLTYKPGTLATRAHAFRYAGLGTAVVTLSISVTCVVGAAMATQGILKQEWLVNLRDTCGQEFETDEEGLLVANSNGMYYGSMATYTSCLGLLGLYLGQVYFRYRGVGRLGLTAYTSKSGIHHQVLMSVVICVLYYVPTWMERQISGDSLNLWQSALLVIALPRFVIGFILSYNLPKLTHKIASYPATQPEVSESDDASDPEKGKQLKNVQITEKLLPSANSLSEMSSPSLNTSVV